MRGLRSAVWDPSTTPRQIFFHRIVILYTHVWILEGAVRKWVPGTDTLMYFARDGLLLIAIAYVALRYPSRDGSRRSLLLGLAVVMLCVWSLLGALVESMPLMVVVVGIRTYIAPLLLAYVVWRNEIHTAWRGIVRTLLLYAPLEAGLVIAQVLSPLSSPVNAYAGGIEGTFTTSDGIARATGTFTFSQGLTLYATLALAVCLGCILSRLEIVNVSLAMVSLVSCILLVAISGSRGLVLHAALVVGTLLLAQLRFMRGRQFGLLAVAAGLGWATWLSIQNLLAEVLAAFEARFENAAASEDSYARILRSSFGFLTDPFPLLGPGAGAHSQAGAAAGSSLSWVESDSARWTSELGALGLALAALRVGLGAVLILWAVVNVRRSDALTVSFAAVVGFQLLIGNVTGTPTAQGAFGVALAALLSMLYDAPMTSGTAQKRSVPIQHRTRRGLNKRVARTQAG